MTVLEPSSAGRAASCCVQRVSTACSIERNDCCSSECWRSSDFCCVSASCSAERACVSAAPLSVDGGVRGLASPPSPSLPMAGPAFRRMSETSSPPPLCTPVTEKNQSCLRSSSCVSLRSRVQAPPLV